LSEFHHLVIRRVFQQFIRKDSICSDHFNHNTVFMNRDYL
jgi:nitrate reductase gamma subunit